MYLNSCIVSFFLQKIFKFDKKWDENNVKMVENHVKWVNNHTINRIRVVRKLPLNRVLTSYWQYSFLSSETDVVSFSPAPFGCFWCLWFPAIDFFRYCLFPVSSFPGIVFLRHSKRKCVEPGLETETKVKMSVIQSLCKFQGLL